MRDLKLVAAISAALSGRVTAEFDRIGIGRLRSSGLSPCPVLGEYLADLAASTDEAARAGKGAGPVKAVY